MQDKKQFFPTFITTLISLLVVTSVVFAITTISTNVTTDGNLIVASGTITSSSGSPSAPSYTFSGDTNTGIYRDQADVFSFAAGGTRTLSITNGAVGIGTTNPNASSILDLSSTTKGLLPPILTTTERDAVSSPAEGLLIYNTTTDALNLYTTSWAGIGGTSFPLLAPDGTTTAPSYSFSSDTNTGIFLDQSDVLSISAGGTRTLSIINGSVGIGTTNPQATLEVNGAFRHTCPVNWIWAPGSAKFGTMPGFCVMKYEAKDVSSTATSQPTLTPWVSSLSQETSRAECQELGLGYHLISEREWMTIAENIAATTINDLDDDAGLQIATGHSDSNDFGNTSNAVATIAGADPVVSGCTLTATTENAANAYDDGVCEIRGNGSDGSLDADEKGFYDTGDVWSATGYSAGGENKSQLRTHVLSNGEVIWDFPGNAWEWVDQLAIQDEVPKDATPAVEWLEYTAITAYNSYPAVRPPDDGWSSANGIGQLVSQGAGTATRAFLRGGDWAGGSTAGVFTLNLDVPPPPTGAIAGFRCTYWP